MEGSLMSAISTSQTRSRALRKLSDSVGISWRTVIGGVGIIILLSVPKLLTNPYYLRCLEIAALFGIAGLALSLVYGGAGIVSLGHMGLFGIGAYSSAVLSLKLGCPVWLSIPAALIAAGTAGLLLAISSARLAGVYLAMTTMAFNIVVERLILQFPHLTDAAAGMINIPQVTLFGVPFELESYYYLILFAWLAALYMINNFSNSSWRLVTNSLRETPTACLFMGNSVPNLKILLFVVSAIIIGSAGALFAHMMGSLNYTSFTWDQSVVLLAMVVLGGKRELLGPIVGAVILTYVPLVFGELVEYMNIIYALILLFFLLVTPEGLIGWVHQRFTPVPAQLGDWKLSPPTYSANYVESKNSRPVAELRNVVKHFGGITALNHVSMSILPGEIHALIGPNGAGKTTLVNVITGLYTASEGEIFINGNSIRGKTPDQIAHLGVGRTFQQSSLVLDMTTAENLQIATHYRLRASIISTLLGLASHHRARVAGHSAAIDLLYAVGLGELANVPVRQLPHGYQRLIEIARALGTQPRLLIVDEPAAGLSPEEMRHLQELLNILRSNGIAILLIEHNMEFVMSLADRITVLDFGIKIGEGSPREIQQNEAVLAAYLGE
jgi:ABC-type branched-subunit amino acid transport system ATPase component/ABC-type branched-subunit amino acid transport system permease subunit